MVGFNMLSDCKKGDNYKLLHITSDNIVIDVVDYSMCTCDQKNSQFLACSLKYIPRLIFLVIVFGNIFLIINELNNTEITIINSNVPDNVIACYYNTPNYSAPHQLLPKNINPNLCTHINVAFARIKEKSIYLDDDLNKTLLQITKLKDVNPNLKIMLSIGGASDDSGFPDMVVNHTSRKVFIRSIKVILRDFKLDGIDLDWEFPAMNSDVVRHKRERQHFSQLLREIKEEYKREKRNYLLSVAVAAPESIVDVSYDVDQLNLYADFVNIMTYDYHFYSKYTPFTGLNSPLYSRQSEHFYLSTLNINYTVSMYMQKGLDKDKIVVGIPTYGHSFALVNEDNTDIGSPASYFGTLGDGGGFASYPDICTFITSNKSNVTIVIDEDAKVPYLYRHKEWISFDTPVSVMEKAKYIKERNLRGAMIYSLSTDDHEGICSISKGNGRKFPLSQSVKNTLIKT